MLQMDVVAKRLKAARLAAGLSQHKAADKAGVTRSTIARAEQGVTIPEMFSVAALADAYRVSVDWLLGRDIGETVTFFHTEKQLQALTGLTHDGLWEAGFDLDDWDYGFVTVEEWPDPDGAWGANVPEYQWHLPMLISANCCELAHMEWQGRHYYMRYHA